MPLSRQAITEILLFVALAVLVMGIFGYKQHHDRVTFEELKGSAVSIDGRITEKQCGNHNQVQYSFFVAGRQYSDFSSCVPDCDNSKIGDIVPVTYARNNPSNSTCFSLCRKDCEQPGLPWLICFAIVVFGIARAVLGDERRATSAG
jgi:hypothetical protein